MKKHRNQLPIKRKFKVITTHRQFKPLLITVAGSLFIGIIFGLIVLQMVNQDKNQEAENVHATSLSAENTDESTKNSIDLSAITVFIHQGGVFSTAENAQEYSKELQQAQIPFIQRENDGQFFIWMNIAETEQQAKSQADEMDKQGIDVFIKKWEVPAAAVELDEKSGKWLQSFQALYNTSLQADSIDINTWQPFIEEKDLPEQLEEWKVELKQLLAEEQDDQLLLDILAHYEQLIKDIKS